MNLSWIYNAEFYDAHPRPATVCYSWLLSEAIFITFFIGEHIHLGFSKMNMFYRQTKFDSVLCVLPVREEQKGLQTATDPGNNTFYIFFFFILSPARNRVEVIWFSRGHLLLIVWPAGRCGQVFVQTAAREKTESEWEKRESVPEWDSYAEWEMMMRKKITVAHMWEARSIGGPHVGLL